MVCERAVVHLDLDKLDQRHWRGVTMPHAELGDTGCTRPALLRIEVL